MPRKSLGTSPASRTLTALSGKLCRTREDGRDVMRRWARCSSGGHAARPMELQQIVCETDQAPLPPGLAQAAHREPPEAPRLFDLSQHRFDYTFPQRI